MSRTWAVALLLGAAALMGADAAPRSLEGLSYVEEPDASDPQQQTLDLHLPEPGEAKGPLVVFVHSRFWSAAPGGRVLFGVFAKPLRRLGAAVAIVRHRLAPEHRHPAAAQDVAAALRFLVENAERYGYDPGRIFLAGHSSGAHLAALVALDPRYLEAEGLGRDVIAGVVGISGPYDLDAEEVSTEELGWYEQAFGDAATRRQASPQRLVRQDAPRFLLLAAQHDVPGYIRAADAFAAALRDAGHTEAESYVVMGRTHVSILDLEMDRAGTPMYVLDFLGLQKLPPAVAELREASRFWRDPPFSTEPLWTSGAPVHVHEADERFVASAGRLYQGLRHKRITFRPERFHAIDLFELLEALGPERVGRGKWLVTSNAQKEKGYFLLEELRPYRPVVVIGLDGERNPFRNVDVFRARREYSWREDLPAPTYSARPMGAFLYLLEPAPPELLPPPLAGFSLGASSFQLTDEDPLVTLRDVEPALLRVLTTGNGCVQCHSFRGVGSRAGHLKAVDGQLQGGFALPLEEYPAEVWKRFVFEPEAAAELVGAPLNPVRGPVAAQLFELVEGARREPTSAQAR